MVIGALRITRFARIFLVFRGVNINSKAALGLLLNHDAAT